MPIDQLQSFLMIYSMILGISLLVSIFMWFRTPVSLYRGLLGFWLFSALHFGVNGAVAGRSDFTRLLAFSGVFPIGLMTAYLLGSMAGFRPPWRIYFAAMLAALGLTPLLRAAGVPLLVYSLLIPAVLGAICIHPALQGLLARTPAPAPALRGLSLSVLVSGLHMLVFPFCYTNPKLLLGGFVIAIAQVILISAFAPAAIVEALANDVARLKIQSEFEVRLVQSAKMAVLGEMAGGVAHEINNPLAVLSMSSELLKERFESGPVPSEALQKHFAQVDTMVGRIAKIVQGLRTFAHDSKTDAPSRASLPPLIESTIALCAVAIKAQNISLVVDPIPEVSILCRPSEVSQILMNLIQNSRDALESIEDRWIRISFMNHQAAVELSVVDSGLGIAASDAEKLMQPFFTTKPQGTGLGLSIASGLARGMNGDLRYDSSHGNTRFVLELKKET